MPNQVDLGHRTFQAQDGRRHLLIGFDARQKWLPMANWWPQNGPFLYVLRDEAERLYSVDKNIWSSVCSVVPDLRRPDGAGPLPPLWDECTRLVQHLATKPDLDSRPYSLIAITLNVDSLVADAAEWLPLTGPDGPDLGALDSTWTLLGYDVANPKLLSGLSNTPYHTEHENVDALRARWAPHLNEHHLFQNADQAIAFIPVCESRARNFGPYAVYGLWESR